MQHRGGPIGFLRPVSDVQLAFLDFRGNRQLLKTGNVIADPRVSLFLMDYPRRDRLNILGHMRVFDPRENSTILARLSPAPARSQPERIVVIDIVSFDWNCPKYITPRDTGAEMEEQLYPLRQRNKELETLLGERNRKSTRRMPLNTPGFRLGIYVSKAAESIDYAALYAFGVLVATKLSSQKSPSSWSTTRLTRITGQMWSTPRSDTGLPPHPAGRPDQREDGIVRTWPRTSE